MKMTNQSPLSQWFHATDKPTWFAVFILGFFFCVTLFDHDRGGKLTGTLLLFCVPFAFVKAKQRWQKGEKTLLILCGLLLLSIIPSYLISSDVRAANGELEKFVKWFFVPLSLFFIVRRANLKWIHLLFLLLLSSWLIIGISIFEQWVYAEEKSLRSGQIIHAFIPCWAKISGALASVFFYLTLHQKHYKYKYTTVMALTCLLLTMVLIWTGTRGVWIAAFVTYALILLHWLFLSKISKIWKWVTVILSLVVSLIVSAHPYVETRVNSALSDVQEFISDPRENGLTSLGVRFAMYYQGWHLIQEYPLWGVGIGSVYEHVDKYDPHDIIKRMLGIDRHEKKSRISYHNEWLDWWVTKGTISVFLYMLLHVWLLYYCKSDNRCGSPLQSNLQNTFFWFVVCFSLSGLSDNVNKQHHTIFFFMWVVSFLIHLIEKEKIKR